MSDEVNATPPPPKPSHADIVIADLKKYGEALLPGAAESLGAIWNGLGAIAPDKRAEELHRRLESDFGKTYLNPEYAAPKLENGLDQSPLRRALERNADRLAPGKVDVLTAQLGGQVAGKSEAQVAGHVEKWLNSRDADAHRPGAAFAQPDPHQRKLMDILERNFPGMDMRGPTAASVFRDPRFRQAPEAMVVSIVAATMGFPADDPRRSGRRTSFEPTRPPAAAAPAPQPVRGPDGKFVETVKPAEPTPARKSLAH
jgi:hypothetical protein